MPGWSFRPRCRSLNSPVPDDPQWIYEIKQDGFRALAVIEHGQCGFFSRKKHKLYGLRDLAKAIVREVHAGVAVLDGKLAVPDETGRTVFAAMMTRRQQARFYAFDLLWLEEEDLRRLPLLNETHSSARSAHILYADHTRGAGIELYRHACQLDLEGIVAKAPIAHMKTNPLTRWIKIKNPGYSQKEGRPPAAPPPRPQGQDQ